jgi:hypothetical protein
MSIAARDQLKHLKPLMGSVRSKAAQELVMLCPLSLREAVAVIEEFANLERPESLVPLGF